MIIHRYTTKKDLKNFKRKKLKYIYSIRTYTKKRLNYFNLNKIE